MRRSPREIALDLVSPQRAVFLLLLVLLVAIVVINPMFAEPGQFMRFLQRVAPVAIVAMGQYFVIVSGEFDLSMGSLVTAQVVGAGALVGQDGSRTVPVLVAMLAFGALVGLVNGLATTFLRVPSFIVTLGMMLALLGGVLYWTGGAATGNPADQFRRIGRGGWQDVPLLDFVPYSVALLVALLALALWYTRRPAGRLHVAVGDNVETARYAGARIWWVKTRAFMISSLSATVAGVLLVGYAGVHPSVGRGYEFTAITAVVLGGVVLGGGRGWIVGALAGAVVLEALFVLLNYAGVPATIRPSVQGVIIIAAVAYSALDFRRRRSGPAQASPDGGDVTAPMQGGDGVALIQEPATSGTQPKEMA